jgi:hypothetical protein
MFYYEVFYETIPTYTPPELEEDGAKDIQLIFYFETKKKLDSAGIKYALEYSLRERKINYEELRISQANEISERNYYSHTRYE